MDIDPLLEEDLSDFQTTTFGRMLKELLWRAFTRSRSSQIYTHWRVLCVTISDPACDCPGGDIIAHVLIISRADDALSTLHSSSLTVR